MDNHKESRQNFGQSLWINDYSREFVLDGTLLTGINDFAITGLLVTLGSFCQALTCGSAYDDAIRRQLKEGRYGSKLALHLLMEDTRYAADQLRSIFERSDGVDGWAVLPLSPFTGQSKEALPKLIEQVYRKVDRPNVLITLPGDKDHFDIIEAVVRNGLPVNISAIYSLDQWQSVTEVVLRGIEGRIADRLRPVVPVFISVSILKLADVLAESMSWEEAAAQAVFVAGKIYTAMQSLFDNIAWQCVFNAGARPLRLVWSSSCEERDPESILNITAQLVAPFSVMTLSEQFLKQFTERRGGGNSLCSGIYTNNLPNQDAASGKGIESIARELQNHELKSYKESWIMMFEVLAKKSAKIASNKKN